MPMQVDGCALLTPDDRRKKYETSERILHSVHNEKLVMIRQFEQSGDSFNDISDNDAIRNAAKLTMALSPIAEQTSAVRSANEMSTVDVSSHQYHQHHQRGKSDFDDESLHEGKSSVSRKSNGFDAKPLLPVAAETSLTAAVRSSRTATDQPNKTDNGVDIADAVASEPIASAQTTSTVGCHDSRLQDEPVDEKKLARSIKLQQKLMDAVNEKKPSKIKKLLKSRDASSAMVTAKLTPLHVAVRRGSADLIRPFIDVEPNLVKQADPKDGSVALLVAVATGRVSTIQWLVDRGGARLDVRNAQTGDGIWDLTRRLPQETTGAGVVGGRTIALVMVGLFNKYRGNYATTPVHEASAAGDVEMIEYLIGVGFDLWADDRAGYNFVHIAAFNDKPEIIRRFLKQVDSNNESDPPPLVSDAVLSTSVERKNVTTGKTPLHVAANRGSFDSLAALLMCGARPATTDSAGWTALHDAAASRSESSSADIIRTLVRHSPDVVKSKNVDGETPLHIAARHGRLSAARVLAELVPHTLTAIDRDGWTPLHGAVHARRPDVVSAVVNAAIDALGLDGAKRLTSTGDRKGRTPQQLVVQGHELTGALTKALEVCE